MAAWAADLLHGPEGEVRGLPSEVLGGVTDAAWRAQTLEAQETAKHARARPAQPAAVCACGWDRAACGACGKGWAQQHGVLRASLLHPTAEGPVEPKMVVCAIADEGDAGVLYRPCVDCGLQTGRFCDYCRAADRMPGERWAAGQRTPLCSFCDNEHDSCHYCRGKDWATPPPKGKRPAFEGAPDPLGNSQHFTQAEFGLSAGSSAPAWEPFHEAAQAAAREAARDANYRAARDAREARQS